MKKLQWSSKKTDKCFRKWFSRHSAFITAENETGCEQSWRHIANIKVPRMPKRRFIFLSQLNYIRALMSGLDHWMNVSEISSWWNCNLLKITRSKGQENCLKLPFCCYTRRPGIKVTIRNTKWCQVHTNSDLERVHRSDPVVVLKVKTGKMISFFIIYFHFLGC